ncbi:MAG: DNA primase [Burkholderiales bacterium]|nr:DNA primase [Burkholderiales bacterium]
MARIPEEFVQDLLNRLDIVEVVERYLPLKKAGQNYQACCPFHKEKSPSFTVSPTKQFYHCFGCGAHGSAVGFVMEYEGLSFPETVTKLAESVGMQMPQLTRSDDAPKRARQTSLVELNTRAMHYYRAQLKESPRAIDYLKRRGLTGQIAARFGLGFAPDDWHPLASCFGDYATNPQLAEVGLVVDHADTGRRYDRFRDRVIFPILDGKSQVIGFGGRVIDKGEPKYLNSPETPLFQKGLELYGLPQARQAIREHNRVLVVEGYMDVVALAQHGVEYAVATLGTACTPDHVKKLMRLADHVVFSFDGDRAGRKAAWRALENSLALASDAKTLSFLFLPSEHDPDSYIREYGKDAFEGLITREALGLAAFMTRELASQVELSTEEGRAKFLYLAKPLVEQIKAPALAMLLRKKLAEMTGLDSGDAAQLLGGAQPAPQRREPRQNAGGSGGGERKFRKDGNRKWSRDRDDDLPPPTPKPPADISRELLQLLMAAPSLAMHMPHYDWPHDSLSPTVRAILRVVDFVTEQPQVPASGHVLEMLREDASYPLLMDAMRRGEEHYGGSDEESLRQVWTEGLGQLFKAVGKRAVEQRVRELEAIGIARLSDSEKAELLRLTGLR